jgi:catechol 2,3-dioxygenase
MLIGMSTSPVSNERSAPDATLPAALRLGPTYLTVMDLDRSVPFYEDAIGLQLHRREDGVAALGAGGEDLLVLVEQPDAVRAGRHAGLYHVALLSPSRLELGRAVKRLMVARTPISGASDHGISEAIYLSDPDGNGLELAADRPRDRWGDLSDPSAIGPAPLDLPDLLGLVDDEPVHPQADGGLVVGHLHLHVGDVERGLLFYRDVLGFEPMTVFPSAAFVAAGGYHHHVAFNTWRGEGVGPAPANAAGLRHWTVVIDEPALAALRERVVAAGLESEQRADGLLLHDPWRNAVLFTSAV